MRSRVKIGRGRPRNPDKPTLVFYLRTTEAHRALFDEAADAAGKSTSAWMRDHLVSLAEKELAS